MGQWDCRSIHAQAIHKPGAGQIGPGIWMDVGWRGVRGDHHNFKHPASRFIVTIVHPQKDVPVGRAVDTVKKIRLEIK
jgi:predicted RNA binding protein YcfA (HicA-like mRNA interferase family)